MLLRRTTPIFAVLLLAPATGLFGQAVALSHGDRVRVSAPTLAIESMTGMIAAVRPDTLVIDPNHGSDRRALPVPSFSRIQLSAGERSNTGAGVGIGFLAGAIVGATVGYLVGSDSCGGGGMSYGFCVDKAGAAGALGLGGGLVGAGIGALIGSRIKTERWMEVPLDRIQLGTVPEVAGGWAIRFSVPAP